MSNPTPLTRSMVRGQLLLLGWSGVDEWAKAHHYKAPTVCVTLRNWGARTDREPHGGLGRQIMRDLRTTLELGVRPQPADSHQPQGALA